MKLFSLLVLGLLCLFPASAEVRNWKEADSNRSISGELIRVEDGKAWIRLRNSSVVKVATERFSEADQKRIAEFQSKSADSAPAKAAFKWETDFEAALARAEAENKSLLLDFTGSDWCGWCVRLKDEVFSKKEFKEYAQENLILVELDFPRQKKLSKELKKQNQELAKKFGVRGYPTIILLDKKGKKVGQTGYKAGGPKAYVEHLEKMLK